ncbi:MAG: GNAT family N-acetyltransferase [Alphaproteobacteria bacterium]|nr:GNAT family N-acetyltransferase [Alphaproteobacteria bacterium]
MSAEKVPDVAALERACLTAVPAQRVAFDGSFVVRSFLGGTGRANAASSLSPADDPDLAARVARIEARYEAQGLPVRFRSVPLDPPGFATMLSARGYVTTDETIIFVVPAEDIARADADVRVLQAPDADWMAVTATAEHQVPARRVEKERAVSMTMVPAAWLVLHEAGKPVACISAVADGALAGFFDLAVVPEARRRGLSARITRAAAHWAQAHGARWIWAQVAASNQASCAAQQSLGMREAYRYVYYVRPQDKLPAMRFG